MYKDCAKVHKLSDLLALQAFLYWSQIEGAMGMIGIAFYGG